MPDLLEKPETIAFTVTEYRRGCDIHELLSTAGKLAGSDEYLSGTLDDGFGTVSWGKEASND